MLTDLLLILPTLWWLFFFSALGLAIGSFANVLIHRLPLDRSPREPQWSACPHCQTRIRWHDNIPVLSFLLLRGRCRNCKLPISVRYPVVELAMALLFVALADVFLLTPDRVGLRPGGQVGTDRLVTDWPILLAHVILFASLFVMSAIDLEHYWVDIRFSSAAAFAGFVLHTLWTPKHSLENWPRPSAAAAAISLAVLAAVGAVWVMISLAPWREEEFAAPDAESGSPETPPPPASPYQSRQASRHWPVLVLLLLMAAVWVTASLDRAKLLHVAGEWRAGVIVAALFVLILAMAQVSRPSDQSVYASIEEESVGARAVAFEELLIFVPALLFAGLVAWLVAGHGDLRAGLGQALHWSIGVPDGPALASWQPLNGLATAALGFVVGGALGWLVRIVFTLAFGKEAFGTGDIHMMAAAGCVAGWPVVVLGFFLACFLAMIGWLTALPFKRTRAVPLGPWLSLGFFVVVMFYEPIVDSRPVRNVTDAVTFLLDPTQPPLIQVSPEP